MNRAATDPRGQTGGRPPRRDVDGILLLDKPPGLTSNAALQRVKRLFQARKAGHTGSLDPLASGMLPICLGQATKVSGFLLGSDKVYRVTARFGSRTDTADADGRVIERTDRAAVGEAELERALARFRGPLQQIPPMYSALKQQGRRLYELAREGKEVAREPRSVVVHELVVEQFDPVSPVLRVRCSKGTYVRTLVEDIAAAAGTLGHVAALRRLAVVPFEAAGMVSLDELEALETGGLEALDRHLLPVDSALANWPEVELGANEAYYLRQGHAVTGGSGQPAGMVRIYDRARRFLGVGELLGDGQVTPRRLFRLAGGDGPEKPL